MSSTEESRRLLEALVRAYPAHVRHRVPEPPPCLESALEEGSRWLEDALAELLATPFSQQRRGPLELFQEAMEFPTRCLSESGRPPVRRDPVVEAALPGDLFDLAPASTQELGDEVWQVHVAWGVAKARAITQEPPP